MLIYNQYKYIRLDYRTELKIFISTLEGYNNNNIIEFFFHIKVFTFDMLKRKQSFSSVLLPSSLEQSWCPYDTLTSFSNEQSQKVAAVSGKKVMAPVLGQNLSP